MQSPGYIYSLLIILYFQDALANCFRPNGKDRNVIANATVDLYQPCSNDGFSMCCRLRPLNDPTVDVCRSDGLCYNPGAEIIWRESCTDQTWKSPNCLKLCVSNEIGQNGNSVSATDAVITACNDGSLCCGDSNTAKACCASGQGVWIVNGQVTNVNPSGTSTASFPSTLSVSSTLTTYSTLSTSSPLPSSTSVFPTPSGNSTSNHTSAIIGGVVGSVGGVAVIAAAIWFLLHRQIKSNQTPRPLAVELNAQDPQLTELDAQNLQLSELDAQHLQLSELDAQNLQLAELDSQNPQLAELCAGQGFLRLLELQSHEVTAELS